ncbi:hypothetical protein ACOBR2_17470 [Telmatobacter bradus]|uniref:hypothetical protein n=1 Tax=Telmatobacter bradus TaxID=474953 RepID=UPI003B42F6E1
MDLAQRMKPQLRQFFGSLFLLLTQRNTVLFDKNSSSLAFFSVNTHAFGNKFKKFVHEIFLPCR